MTYEQMKNRVRTIDLLEKDLMRDLTTEEKDLVTTEGFRKLFEVIGLNDETYKQIRLIKELVGQFCTGSEEDYENAVNKADKSIATTLRCIAYDIDPNCTCDNCTCNKEPEEDKFDLGKVIQKLKVGETLELEPEQIDQVVDWLWEHEDKVKIEVKNNKICLK